MSLGSHATSLLQKDKEIQVKVEILRPAHSESSKAKKHR
jgi:hypothetical protein